MSEQTIKVLGSGWVPADPMFTTDTLRQQFVAFGPDGQQWHVSAVVTEEDLAMNRPEHRAAVLTLRTDAALVSLKYVMERRYGGDLAMRLVE